MLTSRILPLPVPRSLPSPWQAPVATFFNVPRRYVKSSMHVDDGSSSSSLDDAKPAQSLQKNSVSQSTLKEGEPTSSALSSPRAAIKRLAQLEEVKQEDRVENGSPEDKDPPSATSTGSGEFSNHVCLCQPEPKIPRPRNGEFEVSFFGFSGLDRHIKRRGFKAIC